MTIDGFNRLRVQGTSNDAVAYAAAASVPGATSSQAARCMTAVEAALSNRDYHLICGGKNKIKPRKLLKMEAERAYRQGQRMGFIPIGILGWLFSSGIFWQIIISLVSHWISNGGRWFSDD